VLRNYGPHTHIRLLTCHDTVKEKKTIYLGLAEIMLRHVTVKEKKAILTATIKTMRVFMGLHMQVFAKNRIT
jgi:hypothetical protein